MAEVYSLSFTHVYDDPAASEPRLIVGGNKVYALKVPVERVREDLHEWFIELCRQDLAPLTSEDVRAEEGMPNARAFPVEPAVRTELWARGLSERLSLLTEACRHILNSVQHWVVDGRKDTPAPHVRLARVLEQLTGVQTELNAALSAQRQLTYTDHRADGMRPIVAEALLRVLREHLAHGHPQHENESNLSYLSRMLLETGDAIREQRLPVPRPVFEAPRPAEHIQMELDVVSQNSAERRPPPDFRYIQLDTARRTLHRLSEQPEGSEADAQLVRRARNIIREAFPAHRRVELATVTDRQLIEMADVELETMRRARASTRTTQSEDVAFVLRPVAAQRAARDRMENALQILHLRRPAQSDVWRDAAAEVRNFPGMPALEDTEAPARAALLCGLLPCVQQGPGETGVPRIRNETQVQLAENLLRPDFDWWLESWRRTSLNVCTLFRQEVRSSLNALRTNFDESAPAQAALRAILHLPDADLHNVCAAARIVLVLLDYRIQQHEQATADGLSPSWRGIFAHADISDDDRSARANRLCAALRVVEEYSIAPNTCEYDEQAYDAAINQLQGLFARQDLVRTAPRLLRVARQVVRQLDPQRGYIPQFLNPTNQRLRQQGLDELAPRFLARLCAMPPELARTTCAQVCHALGVLEGRPSPEQHQQAVRIVEQALGQPYGRPLAALRTAGYAIADLLHTRAQFDAVYGRNSD